MLKNYYKIGVRSVFKNKLVSFINASGLSIAIGCSLVVFVFLDFSYNMDDFHENADKIFIVESVINREGGNQLWGTTPLALGPALKKDFPQIENMARVVDRGGANFKYGDVVMQEWIRFVDPQFLEMFTFKLKEGNPSVLQDQSKLVITPKIAEKYFGNENPIGKDITITFKNGKTGKTHKEAFTIGALSEEIPKNASFSFNILASLEILKNIDIDDMNSWTIRDVHTFIQVNSSEKANQILSKTQSYLDIINEKDKDWPTVSFAFDPLREIALKAHDIRDSIAGFGHPAGRIALGVLAFFLLTLACFNYINIALVSGSKRLKEIGVRKVMGGKRKQLIIQFLSENLIICFLALAIGVLLAEVLFLPGFNAVLPVTFDINYFNYRLWFFFLGVLLLTVVGGGAYPALYISKFRPAKILKNNLKIGGKNKFTRVLLIFQFTIAFSTLSMSIAFISNKNYMESRDWGYNQAQTLVIPFTRQEQFNVFKNQIEQQAGVQLVAGSRNHIGRSSRKSIIDVAGQKHDMRRMDIGFDYIETMGLRLKEGRFFDKNAPSDKNDKVVVNEKFLNVLGWKEDVIGATFRFDSTSYTIVGVVEDFHQYSFYTPIYPMFLRVVEEEYFNYVAVRISSGNVNSTSKAIEEQWKALFPDDTYKPFYQDSVFDDFFIESKGNGQILGVTAIVALFISCIGLFGLVSMSLTRRMKEFSIRKVLGAGIWHMTKTINQEFLILLFVASIVGTGLSYYLVKSLFDSIYQFHMPITIEPSITTAAIFLITALLTISSQVYKAILINPVKNLRNE